MTPNTVPPTDEVAELKPCPFCGGLPISGYTRNGRVITCQQCQANAAPAFHGRADGPSAEARARQNWNLRTPARPAPTDVEAIRAEYAEDLCRALRSAGERVTGTTHLMGELVSFGTVIERAAKQIERFAAPPAPVLVDLPELEQAALDAVEALATTCEWFGQREAGEPTTNSEAAIFQRLSNLSARFEGGLGLALRASPTPAGGDGAAIVPILQRDGAVVEMPADVLRLVIAARDVAYEDQPGREALRELDLAAEAFASRIPWENEPEAAG